MHPERQSSQVNDGNGVHHLCIEGAHVHPGQCTICPATLLLGSGLQVGFVTLCQPRRTVTCFAEVKPPLQGVLNLKLKKIDQ